MELWVLFGSFSLLLLIGLFSLEKLAQLFAGNDLMADKSGRAGLE